MPTPAATVHEALPWRGRLYGQTAYASMPWLPRSKVPARPGRVTRHGIITGCPPQGLSGHRFAGALCLFADSFVTRAP